MNATHCPPARLAALTAMTDLLTRIEFAHDPNDALNMCGEFPGLILAIVDVLGEEGATADPPAEHGGEHAALPGRWAAAVTEPASVLSNCDSCRHDYVSGRAHGCRLLDADDELYDAINDWTKEHCETRKDARPDPGATGCPGWKARESAPETAEDVAKRCGLIRDGHAPDCWSVAETGASRVWMTDPGRWKVFEYPLVYPTELAALRAYAASVGK